MVDFDSGTTPRILICADQPEVDSIIAQHWNEEKFAVSYLQFLGVPEEFSNAIDHVATNLAPEEKFTIVAYGEAAAAAMETCSNVFAGLNSMILYYPDQISKDSIPSELPSSISTLTHFAGEPTVKPKHKYYVYPDVSSGFAESGSASYDKVAANLAWTRSLAVVRRAFKIEVDLEAVWENHLELEFTAKDADATMDTMVKSPYVNHIPTMTGGIGYADLHRFYKEFFIPNNPQSTKIRLLSRTIGTSRVVDEMYFTFQHTCEIPWMLPNVKPTNRDVEIIVVSVVCIRGDKLYHEHIYWDQASVLVQLGMIDGTLLPVVGREGTRKVLDENSSASNKLINGW